MDIIVKVIHPLPAGRVEELVAAMKASHSEADERIKTSNLPKGAEQDLLSRFPERCRFELEELEQRYRLHPLNRLYTDICFWSNALDDDEDSLAAACHDLCRNCQQTKPEMCQGCQRVENGIKYQLTCLEQAKTAMLEKDVAKAVYIILQMNKDDRAPELDDFALDDVNRWADLKISHQLPKKNLLDYLKGVTQ